MLAENNIRRLKLPAARHHPHQLLTRNYCSFSGYQWDYSSLCRQRRCHWVMPAWSGIIAASMRNAKKCPKQQTSNYAAY